LDRVARALLVGCGCRGQKLGRLLLADGWEVRGTTRGAERVEQIEAAGIEPTIADPDRVGTVLDLIDDVAVVAWLLGSVQAEAEVIAAIHGPRLERLLERLVDSPVRGFIYESAGRVQARHLRNGAAIVREASERWRIPVEVVDHDPADWSGWAKAMRAAARRITGGR
jgi:nucleoside-diphosphate-sugar epimerase